MKGNIANLCRVLLCFPPVAGTTRLGSAAIWLLDAAYSLPHAGDEFLHCAGLVSQVPPNANELLPSGHGGV